LAFVGTSDSSTVFLRDAAWHTRPIAEGVVRKLWLTKPKPGRKLLPSTQLTQGHRREAKGGPANLPAQPAPRLFVGAAEHRSRWVGGIARRAASLFPERDSSKWQSSGEWQATVPRLALAKSRSSADMPPK
jgi:hypothetical protein